MWCDRIRVCGESLLISIGVVIPTYARPRQTRQAVETAYRQSRAPEQVIVIDDGSPDHDWRQLQQELRQFPVELYRIPHCGHPGRVRNEGLMKIRTTHVALLDSDDLWIREKLEIQEQLALSGIKAQGSGYLTTGSFTSRARIVTPTARTLSLRQLLASNVICNSSVLIERQLLLKTGGLPVSYSVRGIEDYAAWLRVATITKWSLVDQPLVIYSDQPENSMRGTNHFLIPENALAVWDLVAWLRSQGHRIPMSVVLASKFSNFILRQWAERQGPKE